MSSHSKILARCQRLIPPLSPDLHKGQAGRIGIVGGSKDYSGAPFFASMTPLRLGADLAHVICEPSAGNIIKTYSPDLIVHTDLAEDSTHESLIELFESLLPRLHVLVIGPGLGRSSSMQLAARTALSMARKQNVYVVIDADGLFLVQQDPSIVKGYARAVLTPNVVEFKRLCQAVNLDDEKDEDPSRLAGRLASALGGVTILQKGSVDRITNSTDAPLWTNEVTGSVRRCGGQGDVLSGAVGTFLAWGKNYEEREAKGESDPIDPSEITRLAAYAGSTITRTASRITFDKMKRAMQTSDMLNEVGRAFEEVFPEAVQEEKEGRIKSKV